MLKVHHRQKVENTLLFYYRARFFFILTKTGSKHLCGTYCLQIDYYLTAMVPIFQEYDGRRNVVTVENRSGLKETTLLIEGFKPGLSLCLFVTIQ